MRLVIIGAGFAGMHAALSAARLRDIQGVSPEELEIALVAPEPTLVVRPRLYESKPETLTAPLLDVLKAIDVTYVQGSAETVDTEIRTVHVVAAGGAKDALLRSAGRGLPAAGCSVRMFQVLPNTASALTSSTMRLPSTGICTVWPIGRRRTGATRSSLQAAGSPASRRRRRCPRGFVRSSARTPRRASSSSIGIVRSLPIWAQVPRARHRGRPAQAAVWRPGSVPASRRSTNPASRCSDGEHIETETVIWAAGIRAAPLTAADPGRARQFRPAAGRPRPARAVGGRRVRHRRRRPGSLRR